MAFGKDRNQVNKMNFRQQARRGLKKAPRGAGGGGGGAPYYVNKYQPPTSGPADIIRLIPGEYETPRVNFDAKDYEYDDEGKILTDLFPYIKYISYYHGTKNRSCIGSEGPLGGFKGKAEPCIAADWFWWEWRQRQKNGTDRPKALGRREMFALTVLVQAPFYKVPQIDKQTKQVRMNEQTKQPYYDWVKGSKRGNDELAAAGYEKKDGHLQHWSLGFAHWTVLTEYGDSLENHCRSCSGHDCIQEEALLCQACGDAVVIHSETTLSDEDLDKLRNEEVRCPSCNHFGYLEDMIACTQCDRGERATLFDFDLEVKRVETAGDNGKQTVLQILRAIGPKPVDKLYGEDLRKPLNLQKIFEPTSLDKQRELLGTPPSDDDAPAEQDPGQGQRQPSNRGSRSYGT